MKKKWERREKPIYTFNELFEHYFPKEKQQYSYDDSKNSFADNSLADLIGKILFGGRR